MSARAKLDQLIDASRIGRLRRVGALVLDVDDTLLARGRVGGGDDGGEETFADSASAALLPELLRRGFNICLITGHGWRQLEARLVAPIVAGLRAVAGDETRIERLRVYANRGATRINWDGVRHAVDEVYGARHQLRHGDVATLRNLLETLGAEFEVEMKARGEWYRHAFPRFDFATLPARVGEREGAVLVLRPLPSRIHAADEESNPRAEVYRRGLELLGRANLSEHYELAESGRSSIEITRRGVSKETAMRDLIRELSAATGEEAGRVEESIIFVGDEFGAGGNDFVIPHLFPRALCLSVAGESGGQDETPAGVVSLARATNAEGTAATYALLAHLLNLSA